MGARVTLLLLALGGLIGCNTVEEPAQGGGPTSVRQLLASQHCGSATIAQATWLTDASAFRSQWSRMHAGLVEPPAEPKLDFTRDAVLLLEMGSRPTAGFGLRLAATQLIHDGDLQVVSIEWREPPPGSMAAQVLTSPCLVLALPAAMHGRIEVRDQDGDARFALGPRPIE